jgi:hypothetical protein
MTVCSAGGVAVGPLVVESKGMGSDAVVVGGVEFVLVGCSAVGLVDAVDVVDCMVDEVDEGGRSLAVVEGWVVTLVVGVVDEGGG